MYTAGLRQGSDIRRFRLKNLTLGKTVPYPLIINKHKNGYYIIIYYFNVNASRYILSRAVAGCTAADLINGIQMASDGLVTARFFPTYPERAVSLSHWLADWISLGIYLK